jgi:hypothetical protein
LAKKSLSWCSREGEKGLTGRAQPTATGREGAGRQAKLSARGRAHGHTGATAIGWGLAGSSRAGGPVWASAREVDRMWATDVGGSGCGRRAGVGRGRVGEVFLFLYLLLILSPLFLYIHPYEIF